MTNMQIINFKSTINATPKREATQMNTAVIALPAGLETLMNDLVVVTPNTGVSKTTRQLPAGPRSKPKGKHSTGTRYTKEFLEVIVTFIYDEKLNLHQIADILNHYGKRSARQKLFTKNVLHNALNTQLGWSLIEPRWAQWQLDNVGIFDD